MATVQLFVTCLVDAFAPQVGEAVANLLERLGMTVEFPFEQTCCGQPAFNAGFHDVARRMAVHTLQVLDATEGTIVLPSGSCADMIIHHIPDLVADDPDLSETAQRVSARTRELTSFLIDDLGVIDVDATGAGSCTLHHSCHGLRNLGVKSQPEKLIDNVAGMERVELPDATECCGFGGLFALEMPDVSIAMLDRKLDNIEASGAGTVVGGDISCLLHIAGGLHRRGSSVEVHHIAEILAKP
ncbi:MAG: Fe-S oxidoreductase [Gammaproteobacteria bacterium]|nr:Fe-S oxidoreductase [Gammaproteobacteria bacterium]